MTGSLKYMIVIGVFTLLFIQCKTNKTKLENTPPFTVVKATVNDWFGGQRGVKGTKIEFHFDNANVEFQKVYFEHRIENLFKRSTSNNTTVYTANLNKNNRDFNLNSDPKKEYGNTAPKTEIDFPFILEKDQCVITYLQNNKEHFYKVSLKRLKPVYMP